jgi:hypothetical protein
LQIKGILEEATEVELELLGLQESVELLSGVAELDDGQIPPALLEIAQLCGRLPLCLSIVGKLIKTFGGGWEVTLERLSIVLAERYVQEEVPAILKSDMRSLTDAARGDAPAMNLQQRVISSGLNSIKGPDAESIVMLFTVTFWIL